MASGRPDFRWSAKARAPVAFCLAGAAAGAALYFGNLACVPQQREKRPGRGQRPG
jgi:hypothetical protein